MKEALDIIYNGVYKAGAYLFMVDVAYFFYILGRILSEQLKTKLKCFLVIICVSAFLGFLSYENLGSHIEDADPVYGVDGQIIQDFEPTNTERLDSGVKLFVVSCTLLTIGAIQAFRKNEDDSAFADLLNGSKDGDIDSEKG